MKKLFIILFLGLFLISCWKDKEQITVENNIKCADIAIKYTDIILKKYPAKEDNMYLLTPFLREYFYSEKRNTCIWVFYIKNEFDKNTTIVVDLLNNSYLKIEDWISKKINEDF